MRHKIPCVPLKNSICSQRGPVHVAWYVPLNKVRQFSPGGRHKQVVLPTWVWQTLAVVVCGVETAYMKSALSTECHSARVRVSVNAQYFYIKFINKWRLNRDMRPNECTNICARLSRAPYINFSFVFYLPFWNKITGHFRYTIAPRRISCESMHILSRKL